MFRLIVFLPWSAWITNRLAGSAAQARELIVASTRIAARMESTSLRLYWSSLLSKILAIHFSCEHIAPTAQSMLPASAGYRPGHPAFSRGRREVGTVLRVDGRGGDAQAGFEARAGP